MQLDQSPDKVLSSDELSYIHMYLHRYLHTNDLAELILLVNLLVLVTCTSFFIWDLYLPGLE